MRLLLIFTYDFLSDYPSQKHDIAIRYVQNSQTMLEHKVYELTHSFYYSVKMND